jgi:hypothetical protein
LAREEREVYHVVVTLSSTMIRCSKLGLSRRFVPSEVSVGTGTTVVVLVVRNFKMVVGTLIMLVFD